MVSSKYVIDHFFLAVNCFHSRLTVLTCDETRGYQNEAYFQRMTLGNSILGKG